MKFRFRLNQRVMAKAGKRKGVVLEVNGDSIYPYLVGFTDDKGDISSSDQEVFSADELEADLEAEARLLKHARDQAQASDASLLPPQNRVVFVGRNRTAFSFLHGDKEVTLTTAEIERNHWHYEFRMAEKKIAELEQQLKEARGTK